MTKKVSRPKSSKNIEKPHVKNKTCPSNNSMKLTVSFSRFQFTSICLKKKFNNFFRDDKHYIDITFEFIGTILPKITSHSFAEICEGSTDGRILHFHTVDEDHREPISEILKNYNFTKEDIDQMFEGNSIFEFCACLGHDNAARVVCHKVGDILELLFFDTNHHIYKNEKYIKNSLYYKYCPGNNSGNL